MGPRGMEEDRGLSSTKGADPLQQGPTLAAHCLQTHLPDRLSPPIAFLGPFGLSFLIFRCSNPVTGKPNCVISFELLPSALVGDIRNCHGTCPVSLCLPSSSWGTGGPGQEDLGASILCRTVCRSLWRPGPKVLKDGPQGWLLLIGGPSLGFPRPQLRLCTGPSAGDSL